nr:hypothetical protein [Chromobacterium vaccinii]
MKLDESGLAFRIDQPKTVDAKAFYHAQRARQRAVGHDPHHHVHGLWRQRDEIPESVVRGGRLRKAAIRLHLDRMDQVGKFDRVLNEENRNIVADQIPIALPCVELDGEAAYIPRRVRRTRAAGHGGNTGE